MNICHFWCFNWFNSLNSLNLDWGIRRRGKKVTEGLIVFWFSYFFFIWQWCFSLEVIKMPKFIFVIIFNCFLISCLKIIEIAKSFIFFYFFFHNFHGNSRLNSWYYCLKGILFYKLFNRSRHNFLFRLLKLTKISKVTKPILFFLTFYWRRKGISDRYLRLRYCLYSGCFSPVCESITTSVWRLFLRKFTWIFLVLIKQIYGQWSCL